MSAAERGGFDQLAHERYQLVKSASDKCRRVGNRVQQLRKKLRTAELDMETAKRELRLAIDAVQPPLVAPDSQLELPRQACCGFELGLSPVHEPACQRSQL